jgi:hypothetical protein
MHIELLKYLIALIQIKIHVFPEKKLKINFKKN